jgi:hypothetical protein
MFARPWMCVRSGRIPLVGTQDRFRRKLDSYTLDNALLSRREGVPDVDLVKAKQSGLRMLKGTLEQQKQPLAIQKIGWSDGLKVK